MTTRNEETLLLARVARRHHTYKSVWMPHLGEHLPVPPEKRNNHDKDIVYVVRQRGIVGHVSRQLSRTVWHFFFRPQLHTCGQFIRNLVILVALQGHALVKD